MISTEWFLSTMLPAAQHVGCSHVVAADYSHIFTCKEIAVKPAQKGIV